MARKSETGITLDTGALIALERRKQRITALLSIARTDGLMITVPAAVMAEWWRGRTDVRDGILASVDVERMTKRIAKAAGEALAAIPGATTVDAIVMASAAQRGDAVYTSDYEDLARLQAYFPTVRVLRV
jgi:predicted nucleic acid-binding protein